jgi:hypothetical protein
MNSRYFAKKGTARKGGPSMRNKSTVRFLRSLHTARARRTGHSPIGERSPGLISLPVERHGEGRGFAGSLSDDQKPISIGRNVPAQRAGPDTRIHNIGLE